MQFFAKFTADLAHYFIIGQAIAPQIDATKKLIIDIAVELLDQTFVRTTGVMLQEHKGDFTLRAKNRSRPFFGIVQTKSRYQSVPRNGGMDLAQITFQESIEKEVELFCSCGK